MNKNGIVKESTQTKILTASNIKTCQSKRKSRHFIRAKLNAKGNKTRKSKSDRFRNSHSCEAEKKFRKGAIKNLEWGACMGICFTVIATPFIVVARKLLDKTSEKFGF